MSTAAILVVNCGSSSVKADVFVGDKLDNPLSLLVERVGSAGTTLVEKPSGGEVRRRLLQEGSGGADHAASVGAVLDAVKAAGFVVRAVGHRVVHGGAHFSASVIVTPEVREAIAACVPLAPLHNPANLAGLDAAVARLPGVPQVAVFDTAFHQSLPEEAWRYAIPARYHLEHGSRRYGFHGTSHRYVAERAAAFFARPEGTLKLVTLHLGNGCSACAIDGGRAVDTSMGMTPLEGLVMGTRSGDVDPAVVLQLARLHGVDEAERILNKDSGLLGLSGRSHDMRDLEAAAESDPAAALAIAVFARRVRKTVGALAAVLGGLDAVVFTGGIGENSSRVRAQICDGLRVIGALLHERKNNARSGAERDLSTMDSRVRLLVIPTDEERAIARDVRALCGVLA